MFDLEACFSELPVQHFAAGAVLLEQNGNCNCLYFLHSGAVRVSKDGHEIAVVRDRGAVFGDMAVLLGIPHSATVVSMEESSFYYVANPTEYLGQHPGLLWHIAQILGLRLFNLNQYLVDLKRQYEGHDHLGMVDAVLETLMNHQKTSPLRRGEGKRDVPHY